MIVPYTHRDHFLQLKQWNDDRGQVGLKPWMLPDLGYVSVGRAMAFLVTTNSPVAWIAHWTVAPRLPRADRELAFDELIDKIEAVSRLKGFRLMQTLGKVGHGLSTKLERRGYISAPGAFTFFVKEIRS